MFEVFETETFADWLAGLADARGKVRIQARIARFRLGHLGDVKSVGGGVSEMRIDFGPGYRLYFTRRGQKIIFLLVGGDKDSQSRDIARAIRIAQEV